MLAILFIVFCLAAAVSVRRSARHREETVNRRAHSLGFGRVFRDR